MPAVRTTASVEAFKKYWWNRQGTWTTIIVWIAIIVVDILLIAFGRSGNSGELLFFIVIGIFFIIRMFGMPKKLYDKVMRISSDQVETVAFGDIGFTVETRGTNVMEHKEIPYIRVTSAKFKDGWFFITVDQMYTNFFCTSDFIEGDSEELKAILSSKLGSRFIVK